MGERTGEAEFEVSMGIGIPAPSASAGGVSASFPAAVFLMTMPLLNRAVLLNDEL